MGKVNVSGPLLREYELILRKREGHRAQIEKKLARAQEMLKGISDDDPKAESKRQEIRVAIHKWTELLDQMKHSHILR